MKSSKKIVVLFLLVAVCFAGLMFYVPQSSEAYPKDLTLEEYKDNVGKNIDLIIQTYEKIDTPSFRACEKIYQKEVVNLVFFPTAESTLDKATETFLKDDKLMVMKKWRAKRFLHKYYPHAYEFDAAYRASLEKPADENQPVTPFIEDRVYTYQDGSVITFGVGVMSIQYADENPEIAAAREKK